MSKTARNTLGASVGLCAGLINLRDSIEGDWWERGIGAVAAMCFIWWALYLLVEILQPKGGE